MIMWIIYISNLFKNKDGNYNLSLNFDYYYSFEFINFILNLHYRYTNYKSKIKSLGIEIRKKMIHTSKKKKNLEKKLLGPRGRTSKRKEIENRIERISEGKF